MQLQIIGPIAQIETIATSSGIRELPRLRKRYGRGRWRKRKGIAEVRLTSGEVVWAESIGTKQPASLAKSSRLNTSCRHSVMAKSARLVICLDDSGYEVSLQRRKIYVAIPDAKARKGVQLRVVDESGEDYL